MGDRVWSLSPTKETAPQNKNHKSSERDQRIQDSIYNHVLLDNIGNRKMWAIVKKKKNQSLSTDSEITKTLELSNEDFKEAIIILST